METDAPTGEDIANQEAVSRCDDPAEIITRVQAKVALAALEGQATLSEHPSDHLSSNLSMTPNDKASFIEAYFDELERKIALLSRLAIAGFEDEALTLCLVYIDGLAQRLMWPSDKSGFNYVAALSQFANDQELAAIHPKQLAEALERLNPTWQPIARAVRSAFPGPVYELLPAPTVVATLTSLVASQMSLLQAELWRGTVAGIAYYRMRNPAVHALGASTLSFDGSTYRGQPARLLDLDRLQQAARNLAAEARRRSEATGEWFGNDAIVA